MTRRRSLRLRVMVLFCAVVGLLLTGSYGGFYWMFRRTMWDQLDRRLEEAAAPIVADLSDDPTEQDVSQFNISGDYFEVIDGNGAVTQRSKNLPAALPISGVPFTDSNTLFQTVRMPNIGMMRVAIVPFDARANRWFLVAATSTRSLISSLEIARDAAISFVALSLMLTGAVSWFYAKRSLQPITELTREANEMIAKLPRMPHGHEEDRLLRSNDADELHLLSATFNRLFERLNVVLGQMRHFVSDASHEMRTPLSILRGETELLLERPRTPAEYHKALQIIDSELKRLSRIVEGLFTLSMADAGALRIHAEPLYLEEVLQETCASVMPLTRAKNMKIEQDLQQEVLFHGDAAFLRQLFLIFIDNAIKYSPSGANLRITLRADGEANIQFRDEGIGIAPENLPRIFERFFRVSQTGSGETQSGGLGLSIAQAIVQAHRGRIECESAPGAGSVFTIRLPLNS